MRTLDKVKSGETVTVSALKGEGALKRRIMDMGITKGTEVFVRKVAPLGDPVEVTVRGYELTIRKSEAQIINVDWFFYIKFLHIRVSLILYRYLYMWVSNR